MKILSEKILIRLKSALEKRRAGIEKELANFADKDKKLKGDWDTRFPYFDGEIGDASLEKAAEEVEEYEAKLPVEHAFEAKLKNIELALTKIKKGDYGICERCKKPIASSRLKVYPEARLCMKCQQK